MEKFIIYNRIGEVKNINSFAKHSAVTEASLNRNNQNEDTISLKVKNISAIFFELNDYIIYNNRHYILNKIPDVVISGGALPEYSLTLEGISYSLNRIKMLNTLGESEFALTGNISTLALLLIQNLERITDYSFTSFSVTNDIDDTIFYDFNFSNQSCLNVLSTESDKLNFRWDLERIANNEYRLVISKTKGRELTEVLRYGANSQLYSISRNDVNEMSIINRLFCYGGMDNLPEGYRLGAKRIMLPGTISYLEDTDSISRYGLFEGTYIADEIWPKLDASVTAVIPESNLSFIAGAIAFDINQYLKSGMSPKVNFNTGDLAGISFEIVEFDSAMRKITIKNNEEANAFAFKVGDKFNITDINLPTQYVIDAEEKLLAWGSGELDRLRYPMMQYNVEFNSNYNNENRLDVDDSIIIYDDYLKINLRIKISAIEYDIIKKRIKAVTLSNTIQKTAIARLTEGYQFIQEQIRKRLG